MSAKRAIVTGASSGIGQGIAVVLAEHGYDIAISYGENEAGARRTQADIEALGRRCFVYQATLNEADVPARLVDQAAADLGGVDVMVCNAGKTRHYSALTITVEQMDWLYGLNYRSYMLCAGAAARHMVRAGQGGNIIFVTSSRAERAYPEDFLYGGLKAAVKRSCESMALDLAPHGIRVNCIAPGMTRVRDLEKNLPSSGFEKVIPLGRAGLPRENGEAVAFLVSDNAGYITGISLRVDGGLILPGMPENVSLGPVWRNPEWTEKHRQAIVQAQKEE